MIPKLIPNEEFYNTISTGNRQYFRNMEEPYGTMGFNWKWFVFFELPLYTFCGWALYKLFKLIKNNPETFKY